MSGELTGLLERVRAATGQDLDIDAAIAVLCDNYFMVPAGPHEDEPSYAHIAEDGSRHFPGHGGMQLVPDYTSSLDAALSLATRKLPADWKDILREAMRQMAIDFAWHTDTSTAEQAAFLPRYVCAAFLAALSAQEDKL